MCTVLIPKGREMSSKVLPITVPVRQSLRRLIGTASAFDGEICDLPPSQAMQNAAAAAIQALSQDLEALSDCIMRRIPAPAKASPTPPDAIGTPIEAEPAPMPVADEKAKADALQTALATIAATEAETWLRASQRSLLAVFREQVTDYHANHDPLLISAAVWIEGHVARWRNEHTNAVRRLV
jgi:hypothetical protein